ncbi:arylesterase [Shewanella sp. JM162201]|uniref:Arylesterase n=1 Tax=Shewanella jiangmenensis TaxID=2837387 RepID=A0ABS5V7P2_9GAMM|nr:arylesterase [Shewanella jiangmenensis]MBT1445729.1 arylesterase [Shewanella jiangmenensis]
MAFPLKAETILILGDSLSASYGMEEKDGWINLLRPRLEGHTLVSGAVSGETSAGGLRRLPALLESAKPDAVLVMLGGNDGLRGFSPAELKKNLTKIIDLSQASGARVLLSEVMVPTNYGPRYAKAFAEVYAELGALPGVTLMPFFMTGIITDPQLMQRDGIHPNEAAQPKIADFMQPWFVSVLENRPKA